MRSIGLASLFLASLSISVLAQEPRRELGPHVHGVGTLNIAIEDKKLSMDFSAPANDIVGFEHQPSTPEQKVTLDAATRDLAEPLKLIVVPVGAGCKTISADVKFNAASPGTNPDSGKPGEEHQHADFDIDYVIECAETGKINQLSFPYFKRFPNAQKLSVTVVSEKGQSQFDVTRDNPSHDVR